MKAHPAEFLTLREACGLTQADLAEVIGSARHSVQNWESGLRGIPKAKIDALRNLDDLIRDRATMILQPLTAKRDRPKLVKLIRYRTKEDYAAGEPDYVAAGLPMGAYHAMLCRVMDGLVRLGIRYQVRYSDDSPDATDAEHPDDAARYGESAASS